MKSGRDLDLQAILDATDSDSSVEGEGTAMGTIDANGNVTLLNNRSHGSEKEYGFKSLTTSNSSTTTGKNTDLERILRESDDFFYESRSPALVNHPNGNLNPNIHQLSSLTPVKMMREYNLATQNARETDNFSLGGSTISTRPSQFLSNNSFSTLSSPSPTNAFRRTVNANINMNATSGGTGIMAMTQPSPRAPLPALGDDDPSFEDDDDDDDDDDPHENINAITSATTVDAPCTSNLCCEVTATAANRLNNINNNNNSNNSNNSNNTKHKSNNSSIKDNLNDMPRLSISRLNKNDKGLSGALPPKDAQHGASDDVDYNQSSNVEMTIRDGDVDEHQMDHDVSEEGDDDANDHGGDLTSNVDNHDVNLGAGGAGSIRSGNGSGGGYVASVNLGLGRRIGAGGTYGAHHNAEEWAVLQAILGEVEDDDDDDDHDDGVGNGNDDEITNDNGNDGPHSSYNLNPKSVYSTSTSTSNSTNMNAVLPGKPPKLPPSSSAPTHNRTNFHSRSHSLSAPLPLGRGSSNISINVDDILNSMEDDSDSDDDGDIAQLDEIVAKFSINTPTNTFAHRKTANLDQTHPSANSHSTIHPTTNSVTTPTRGYNRYASAYGRRDDLTSLNTNTTTNTNADQTVYHDDAVTNKTFSSTISRSIPPPPPPQPLTEPSSPGNLTDYTSHFLPSTSNKTLNSPLRPLQRDDNLLQLPSSLSPQKTNTTSHSSANKYLHSHNFHASSSLTTTSDAVTEAALQHAEAYERHLLRPGQRDIVSPLMVKRRMKPKIELPTKSRAQQQQQQPSRSNKLGHNNSSSTITSKTGIGAYNHHPKFGFAGIISSRSMPKISTELMRNSQLRMTSVGLPTALTVNSKFIAIGTQRGVILVFDLFEELRQQLGGSGAGTNAATTGFPTSADSPHASLKNTSSVTSIDLSPNGETLIAGYTNGRVVLWDVIKGTILKTVENSHPSPISSVRFLSDQDLRLVTVDAGGLVNKLTFSKTMLWNSYGVETECLLDGTAGQILAMHVLPPMSTLSSLPTRGGIFGGPREDLHANYHPSIRKLVLIALSSDRSSFAVAVEPTVNVLHRWAKPPPERMNVESFTSDNSSDGSKSSLPQVFLPCLSWGWALVSGGGHCVTPILARAWGCCLQLLRANFPPYENDGSAGAAADDTMHWPAFGVHDEFDVSAPVVALEWLGNRSLVYLTLTNEFTVVDTVMMTLTERLDFSGIKLVYAEFSLSRVAAKVSSENSSKTEPSISTTFLNSIRTSDNRLLILCQEEVKSISILGIRQRISTLEEDGEWLEALALALDHYESTIKSQEDRKRNTNGKRDLSNHPEFLSQMRSEDEEWIAELLLRYLNLAVENAPESSTIEQPHLSISRNRMRGHLSSARIDLAQSHFQMLAGVCIEFCVVTRRLDLLFSDIYERFSSVGYTTVFLDVLEPYVLNDKLQYIAPEVMAQFVEHCKETNDVATVERCLLHMDVTIMDFDSILTLLRRNSMYSALLHVFAHGLDDFITPLEILFEAIFDAADKDDSHEPRRLDGVPQSAFEQYGYKAILFLKYCFNGKSFPQGEDLEPEGRVNTLRPQLLRFLRQKKYSPSSSVKRSAENSSILIKKSGSSFLTGQREFHYPYMHALVMVDAKALLDIFSQVFDTPSIRFVESTDNQETIADWHAKAEASAPDIRDESGGEPSDSDTICPDRMDIVRILSSIIHTFESVDAKVGMSRKSQAAKDSFHDFMAKYLLKGVVRAPKPLTLSVLSRMSNRVMSSNISSVRLVAQEEIIALLQVLPRNSYDRDSVLKVVEKGRMTRAALLLHKGGVSELFEGSCDSTRCSRHFMKVIDCYLQDDEPSFQLQAFDYIKKECMGGNMVISASDPAIDGNETTVHDVLRNALCKKLSSLVNLDPVLSSQLVAEIYVEDLETILLSLNDAEEGLVLFKFFRAIISGDLTKADSVAGPVLLANLTIDHHQRYLELMAKFHPDMVYHHLTNNDNYRTEECLKLCQEHEIADASAYLLERMGNVSSALQLMLQTLEGRMMTLKRVLRGLSSSTYSSDHNVGRFIFSRRKKESEDAMAKAQKEKEIKSVKQILTVSLDLCERNSGPSSSKSEHGSQLWFNVLDRLINAKGFLRLSKELPEHSTLMLNVLSDLLQLTMQRMVSKVPLPDLVRKITTDHAGNRLSEFREMIATMLKTYGSEVEICANAADVMQHDVRQMSLEKRRLKLRGSRVQSIMGQDLSRTGDMTANPILYSSILKINSNGDAIPSVDETNLLSETSESALSDALSRLKVKRQNLGDISGNKREGRTKIGLGMMTVNDSLFTMGESSDAAFMSRQIGLLSDAEHYGRLGY